jgi:hypothetical protein
MDYKKILEVLEAEVGYQEKANNDNKYGKEYGLNNQPYCVIFMWWGFYKAGASAYFCGGTKQASCTKVKEWAQANGCWVTKNYQPGDLLMFNFKGTNVTQHIGFLKEIKNGVYYVVEGNTSPSDSGSQDNGDGVWLKKRKLGQIVGAYRPNYAADPSTLVKPKLDSKPKFKNIAGLYKLQKGHKGPAVEALQTLLNLRGANLTVDGDFGEGTQKALDDFRAKYKIKTKICEREVWERLING